MAFHEIYQVYNQQNKQFVKMKNGEILECSYFKYDDIPLFGSGRPAGEDPPPAAKKKDKKKPKNEPAASNKSRDSGSDKEAQGGIFEWF